MKITAMVMANTVTNMTGAPSVSGAICPACQHTCNRHASLKHPIPPHNRWRVRLSRDIPVSRRDNRVIHFRPRLIIHTNGVLTGGGLSAAGG